MIATLALAVALQASGADSLLDRVPTASEGALIMEVRRAPMVARDAVALALRRSVTPGAAERTLAAGRRIADAIAVAWQDSFPLREVDRFERRSPRDRATRVRSDSLRRAGVEAYARDGPAAAVTIWRRALAAARSIGDSAAMGTALDNLGAGFTAVSQSDSATSAFAAAHRIAAAIGDLRTEANVVGHRGDLSADQGDLVAARTLYLRASTIRARIGDTRGVAADLNNLGLLSRDLGDLAEAREQFEAALIINQREQREGSIASNLVNLAGLASLEGDFTRARALYQNALAIWRSREAWSEAAVALDGLGQLELRRGDYPAARRALSDAVDILSRTGPLGYELEVRRSLGDALAAAGDLQGSLDQLERAQSAADTSEVGNSTRAALRLARADLAVRLNALAQAEEWYRDAARLAREASDAPVEAESLQGLAVLFLERDTPARAESLLANALLTQVRAGDRRTAALTRRSLAQASLQQHDTIGARRYLERAASDLAAIGDPVATAAVLGDRAAIEAAAGNPVQAESLYHAGLMLVADRHAPAVEFQLRSGLGLALRQRGQVNAAASELRAALEGIERPASSLVIAERRAGFLADKWEVHALLALTERARGFPAAAFEASERMRAREMLEMMDRARVAPASQTPDDLVEREQDLRRRIAELATDLQASTSSPDESRGVDVSTASAATRTALLRAQAEYADLLVRIRERAPRHAAYVAPPIPAWRDVAQRLARDQAMVTYLVSDSGSLAFVVARDSMTVVDLSVSRRDLARLVEFARGTMERRRADPGSQQSWQRLHALLVAPIERTGLLAGARRLVIVPHAELHYLPFAALIANDGRVLGDRYEISLTPSAAVWLEVGNRSRARAGSGTLAYAPRPDALPATQREVDAIGRALGEPIVTRIGAEATEERFRTEVATRRIVHLAAFGVLNKHNPLFSFVELAPGGSDDGRLETHEVLGLTLVADLVVLSACQTALGSGLLADVPPGDDWVGLTRAFLSAGAARVVASLWPVDDWATAVFMGRFYAALAAGKSAAASLAEAQQGMRSENATADPLYWAGFVLVGGADGPQRR